VYVLFIASDVFIFAGDHVPVIPFRVVAGSGGAILNWQNGPIPAIAGVILFEVVIVTGIAFAGFPEEQISDERTVA
jgi:hypothetical protein